MPAGNNVLSVPTPGPTRDYRQHGVFAVLGARTFGAGTEARHLPARAHPSGQWVEWLSPEPL